MYRDMAFYRRNLAQRGYVARMVALLLRFIIDKL